MPMPFHLNKNAALNGSTSSTVSANSDGSDAVGIDREDPSKIFVELTEIGHGNFGAVYFVSLTHSHPHPHAILVISLVSKIIS